MRDYGLSCIGLLFQRFSARPGWREELQQEPSGGKELQKLLKEEAKLLNKCENAELIRNVEAQKLYRMLWDRRISAGSCHPSIN